MAERLWYKLESTNHLITSEAEKRWTENSPNSKLSDIESRLKSTKSNEAKTLKNLIKNGEYKDFQKKIWITSFPDLDWKLWKKTFSYFVNYIEKFESQNNLIRDTRNELGEFMDYVHLPEFQQLSESSRIHKNAKEYLSKYETMSEFEYNRIFSGKEEIWQWQLGDCYLISWIIELTNTQYFDTLMRTSITRVQFKDDWSLWYNVRIPLWEPHGRDILIKDSELGFAKIKWNIGYKLLEIAYVKNRRKNNTEWNKYSPVSEWEVQRIAWWWTNEVLQTFLGRHNIWFSDFWSSSAWNSWRTLSSLPQSNKTEITNYLRNFDWKIWNTFTNLVTWPSKNWDRDSFNVWWNTLYNQHAYALSSVEKDENWNVSYVNVKNPRNNQRKAWGADTRLSLNEFFHAFSYIWVGKIKVNGFLDDKWISYA